MADNQATVAIRVDDQSRAGFESFRRSMNELEGGFSRLRAAAGYLSAALAGGYGIAQITKAGIEAEQSQRRLEAVLRATGYSAGVTKKELEGLNDELVDLSGFDDEAIRNAQAELLKFGTIGGETFKRAMRDAVDFAAFTGTDLVSAAQKIGAVLTNQEGSVGKLGREFGNLTKAEQDAIEKMIAVGDIQGAMGAKLAVIESKIKGTAAAMNTGLVKATNELKIQWDELLEEFARTDGIVGGTLSSAFTRLAAFMRDLRTEIRGGSTELTEYLNLLAKLPGPFGILGVAGKGALAAGRLGAQTNVATGTIEPSKAQAEAAGRAAAEREAQRLRDSAAAEKAKENAQRAKQAAAEAKRIAEEEERLRRKSFDVEDYQGRIAQTIGRAITDAPIVKAKELADQIAALDEMFFSGKIPVEIYSGALDVLTKSTTDAIEKVDELTALLAQTTGGKQAEAARLTSLADEAFFAGKINEEQLRQLLEVINGYRTLQDEIKKTDDFAKDFGLTMVSAFSDAIVEGKKVSDVLRGLAKDLAQLVFKRTVSPLLDKAAGGIAEVIGKIFGGIFGSQRGNVFASSGVVPFASGGIVSRPVIFPFAGGVGLMGEAGPEAILPLRRSSSGRLGVESGGGASGGPQVSVVINASAIDARSLDQMLVARSETIAAAVTKALNARGRPGPLG